MEQKTFYHKRICLCRKCKGTGKETFFATTDVQRRYPLQRTCKQCNGSGRVEVSGERILRIEPYDATPVTAGTV